MITSIIAFLLRLFFLAVFTFAFVVLFEHGPSGFVAGIPVEWNSLVDFVSTGSKNLPL